MPPLPLQIAGAEVAHDNLALPQGDTQRFVLPAPGLRHRPTGPQQATQQQFVDNTGKQLLQNYGGNGGINTGPSGNGEQMGESFPFYFVFVFSFIYCHIYQIKIMLKTKLNSICLFIYVFDYPLFNSLLTSSPIPRHSRQPTSPGPWDSNAPGTGIRRGMPEGPDEGQDNFRLSFQWCRVLEGMSEGFVTHRKKKSNAFTTKIRVCFLPGTSSCRINLTFKCRYPCTYE